MKRDRNENVIEMEQIDWWDVEESPEGPAGFRLGRVGVAAGLVAEVGPEAVTEALARHWAGDWGDVTRGEAYRNRRGLRTRGRLSSRYDRPDGSVVGVVTAADRSTTVFRRVGLRRIRYGEFLYGGNGIAMRYGSVLGVYDTHPDAPADRPEPVARFEIQTGKAGPVRFVLQGESELFDLREATAFAIARHRGRKTNCG